MQREPVDFSRITRKFTHTVGSLIGLMMPILVILFNSAFNLFFTGKEIFMERLIIG